MTKSRYSNDLSALEQHLHEAASDDRVRSVLLFAADFHSQLNRPQFEKLIKRFPKSLAGGVFPAVFSRGKMHESGFLTLQLGDQMRVSTLPDSESDHCSNCIEHNPQDVNTVFTFFDHAMRGKQSALNAVYNHFGIDVSYFGGGCGSLFRAEVPCVISAGKLRSGRFVTAAIERKISPVSAHGWEPISGYFKVTEAEGNTINTINWRPAFEVYREVVENHSTFKFDDPDFFEIAKSYPLGISRLDNEPVVRDPVKKEGRGNLSLVDRIDGGEYVRVLYGNEDKLLRASKIVVKAVSGQSKNGTYLGFDCVSRALYLKDKITDELTGFGKGEFFGAVTIGEVVNSGDRYLDIFNKTFAAAQL